MKFKKLLGALAVSSVLASGSASAAVTVGGVTWNPSAGLDFSGQGTLFEKTTFAIGESITGFGLITTINGSPVNCAGSCQLTFSFGGYTLLDNNPTDYDPDGAGPVNGAVYGFSPPSFDPFTLGDFAFSGGWLKIYVDALTAFDSDNKATSEDGALWLDLLAVDQSGDNSGITLRGSLTNVFSAGLSGQGTGLFDVIGGLAQDNLDTNSQIGGRDLSYTSSFQPNPNNYVSPDGMNALGNANWVGNSVPEPGMIALLGLGLLGMGVARRNKKVA